MLRTSQREQLGKSEIGEGLLTFNLKAPFTDLTFVHVQTFRGRAITVLGQTSVPKESSLGKQIRDMARDVQWPLP
jgi:hypothetical protein